MCATRGTTVPRDEMAQNRIPKYPYGKNGDFPNQTFSIQDSEQWRALFSGK